jgi:cytochrome oxidase Cu insertion factor (SCO1/SenC/PrrC family)
MTELTPERWLRMAASLEEDFRIYQVTIDEMRDYETMLRERGHDVPAEVMTQAADTAQAQLDRMRASLAEAKEEL